MKKKEEGTLYIVATPIGNDDDISLRAVKILKMCDTVVCEEGKLGARLLHQLRLTKPIEELNEHNEDEQTPHLIEMLREDKTLALISDAGTPLLADPGLELVRQCVQHEIPVIAVPGASSIMTALVTSGLSVHQFLFGGFLPRDPGERLAELESLAQETRTVVLLETPYRLQPLLAAAAQVMPTRRAYLGCNLTMPSETHHYGTVEELSLKFAENKFKGEFVFVFAGNESGQRPVRRAAAERPRAFGHRSSARSGEYRDGGSRKPFERRDSEGGRKPFERRSSEGGRKPFERRSSEGGGKPFKRREDGDKPFERRGFGGGEKPFKRREDGDKPFGRRDSGGSGKTFERRGASGAGKRSFQGKTGKGNFGRPGGNKGPGGRPGRGRGDS